jgi:hypothetical protein
MEAHAFFFFFVCCILVRILQRLTLMSNFCTNVLISNQHSEAIQVAWGFGFPFFAIFNSRYHPYMISPWYGLLILAHLMAHLD